MNLPTIKVQVVRKNQDQPTHTQPRTDSFHKLSTKIANKLGSSWAFFIAVLVIIVWAVNGPVFDFSDTWQLIINTGTTIVTFLMVFVIQNTQNRDGKAIQLKLDELIKSHKGARSEFVNIEELSERELDELNQQFQAMHKKIVERSARREAKKLVEQETTYPDER